MRCCSLPGVLGVVDLIPKVSPHHPAPGRPYAGEGWSPKPANVSGKDPARFPPAGSEPTRRIENPPGRPCSKKRPRRQAEPTGRHEGNAGATLELETIMNIGKLHEQQDGSASGYICTLEMQVNFNLVKNLDKNGDKAPDFLIMAGKVDLGACWQNQAAQTGEIYYSLEMDDPSFPQKLKCAAFKNQDGTWRIVWDRPQAKRTAEPEQAAA